MKSYHILPINRITFFLCFYIILTWLDQSTAAVPRRWWKYIISCVIQENRIRKETSELEARASSYYLAPARGSSDSIMAPYQQQEYDPQVQSQLPQIDSTNEEAFAFLQEHEYIQIREENDRLFTENRNLKHIVQVLRKISSSLIDPVSLSQFVLQHQQEHGGQDEEDMGKRYDDPLEFQSSDDGLFYGDDTELPSPSLQPYLISSERELLQHLSSTLYNAPENDIPDTQGDRHDYDVADQDDDKAVRVVPPPPLDEFPHIIRPTALHLETRHTQPQSQQKHGNAYNMSKFLSPLTISPGGGGSFKSGMRKKLSPSHNNSHNNVNKSNQPYFLNRSSTPDWTSVNNATYHSMLVPLPASHEHYDKIYNTTNDNRKTMTTRTTEMSKMIKSKVKKCPVSNRVEMELTHIPSHSQIKYQQSPGKFNRPKSPYLNNTLPISLQKERPDTAPDLMPKMDFSTRRVLSASSGNGRSNKTKDGKVIGNNMDILDDIVRRTSSELIATKKYQSKSKNSRPTFDNNFGLSPHFESTYHGIDPLTKENQIQRKIAIQALEDGYMAETLKGPFEDAIVNPQYPFEDVPDYRLSKEKRLQKERQYIENVYKDVEEHTTEKRNIIANAIQKARQHCSGKKSYLNKPLTGTEKALAESPLLRNSTSKNHFRF